MVSSEVWGHSWTHSFTHSRAVPSVLGSPCLCRGPQAAGVRRKIMPRTQQPLVPLESWKSWLPSGTPGSGPGGHKTTLFPSPLPWQVTLGPAGRVSCCFCPGKRRWKLFKNNKQARNICIRNHIEQCMLFKPSLVGNRSKKQLS